MSVQPTKYINKLRGDFSFEWKSDELKTVVNLQNDKITQELNPMVLSLFKKISAEDAYIMGFHKELTFFFIG